MKKAPLVLSSGRTGQLQAGDWIGQKATIAVVNPTITDDSASGYEPFSRWLNTAMNREYVCISATAGAAVWILTTTGGGASAFTDLSDVPSSYSGQALKPVRVNAGATGLEFYTPSSGGSERVFIFEPSIGATTGNRYKTWVEIQSLLDSLTGTKEVIFREDATISSVVNLVDCIVRSDSSLITRTITLTNNVTDIPFLIDNLILHFNNSNSNASFVQASAGKRFVRMLGAAQIQKTGQAAIKLYDGAGEIQFDMYDRSSIPSAGVVVSQEATVIANLHDEATVDSGFISGFDGYVTVRFAKLATGDLSQTISYTGSITIERIVKDAVSSMISAITEPAPTIYTSGAGTNMNPATRYIVIETGGPTNISGVVAGIDGSILVIENRTSDNVSVLLFEEDPGSSPANRLDHNGLANEGLLYGDRAIYVYEASRWKLRAINKRKLNFQNVTSNYSVKFTDGYVFANNTINLSLHSCANNLLDGKILTIKNIGTGVITITPDGTELIDGVNAPITLTAQWESVTLYTDGSQWYLI